jgi:hypothetical protein
MKNRSKILMVILPVLACLALSPQARATCLDGCSGFGTFQGDDALISNTTGSGNTAFGWRSLFTNTDGSFNTGVGGGALAVNDGSSNTAVGAAALLLNTTGFNNTAVGTDAMVFNDTGSSNVAVGDFAFFDNTTGFSNVAIGSGAMTFANGFFNTAVGLAAGNNLTTAGFAENIYLGDTAGTLDFNGFSPGDEDGVIRIGSFFSGTNACFINGIVNKSIPTGNAAFVFIDVTTGQLATMLVNADGNKVSPPTSSATQPQAMLNRKVQELEKQVEALTAQLKEQAAQIQKVSAQLEMSKPAAKVVVNKP